MILSGSPVNSCLNSKSMLGLGPVSAWTTCLGRNTSTQSRKIFLNLSCMFDLECMAYNEDRNGPSYSSLPVNVYPLPSYSRSTENHPQGCAACQIETVRPNESCP